MLCCVSKRAVDGDHGPPYENRARADRLPVLLEKIEVEFYPEEDVPPILLPCATCARTFMPQSLEKHKKICEKAAAKKRKPFDSAKQRIQGTELADFLPKQERKRQEDVRPNNKSAWKQTHDEFLRAIRAARGEVVDTPTRQSSSQVTSGAPTRANEKGTCPTCNRHFGIKAYDRHVAWCKERSTRLPVSPATNLAKERFEARMKYRAPGLKNRRPTNREKYSPGSSIALNVSNHSQGNNNKLPSPSQQQVKAKESVSLPSCNKGNDSVVKQRPVVANRRLAQSKEPLNSSGPMKSRVADRTNRNFTLPSRPVWSNYVRRRPDFNLVLRGRIGSKDYDPFMLAEQQMSELLSDTSDQSDLTSSTHTNKGDPFPLSHSSAFVKYPFEFANNKRSSLIAPPTEFDDLTSDFSSDSTETNSLSREIFLGDLRDSTESNFSEKKSSPTRELGRRVIIDKSRALGSDVVDGPVGRDKKSFVGSGERARKILDKVTPKVPTKVVRPIANRSHSLRASSAPKSTPDRKSNNSGSTLSGSRRTVNHQSCRSDQSNQKCSDRVGDARNNSYAALSGSNLSLNSIISSSEVEGKRSNSVFDELMTSFEDDRTSLFPSLKSFLKDDSLPVPSSPPNLDGRHRNGNNSDEELSSPDSYRRQEHGKLSADSAYSSLNRKYSQHGRSTNDIGRFEEDGLRSNRRATIEGETRCKMSKFCHECGMKFPETAKFCCECGVKRLAL